MARFRFLAHAAGVVTMAAVLLTAVLTSPASACTCFPENEALRYLKATYVFSGAVVHKKTERRDGYNDTYRYTVKVGTEYKGDVPRWVYVTTPINNSCRYELTVGNEYIVFSKDGDLSDRRLEIDYCGGTRSAAAGPPVTTSPSSGGMTTWPTTTTCATATP